MSDNLLSKPEQRQMSHIRCAAVAALSLLVPLITAVRADGAPREADLVPTPARAAGGQVVLTWERIAFRTVYTDGATPIPVGVPILGFTSLAMHDAALTSVRRGGSSERAAVATAGHDVLLNYFEGARTALNADLRRSMARIPDGPAKRTGHRIGRRAAAEMIASRAGDGFGDPSIRYTKNPRPGIWQPEPGTEMLAPWLGSLRPVVLRRLVQVDGPDPLMSAAYAADFNEVRRLGELDSDNRTPAQTATAQFFNSNSATMVGEALVRRLERRPIGLLTTTRIFAAMHASMTDSIIKCWRLKRTVGFWRPSQAIQGADLDGNPDTEPDGGWTPLVPNPPYSDYVSGHACLTGPAVEVIRRTLGEGTPLRLVSANTPTPRVYPRLRAIERDAFMARIWSGLHFRDAMVDGYRIGHRTAQRVLAAMK